jgi:hypothetical protein
MMLFVHSVGGILGAVGGAALWAMAGHTTTEGSAGYLVVGSFLGVMAGEVVERYNKKQ